MSKPLVSACMITYNHEPYIAQAIEGVLQQQTNFPFELVIGEDCSTDRTRGIVFDYQEKYPSIIRVITSDKNVGARTNSLRTEKACCGKYVAVCEGDDYWHHPLKLQRQVDFLESHPAYGLVHSNGHVLAVETGELIGSAQKRPPAGKDECCYLDILTGDHRVWTASVCVRRQILAKVVDENPECTDERFLMGDLQRWLEISRLTKIKYLDEALVTLNRLPESASRSQDPRKQLKFSLSVRYLKYRYLQKYESPQRLQAEVKKKCNMAVLCLAHWAGDREEVEAAMRELKGLGSRAPIKALLYHLSVKSRVCVRVLGVVRWVYGAMVKRIC